MEQLTTNQIALIGIAFGVLGGLIGWVGRGFSFLIKRWWMGSARQDQATYLNLIADFGVKMRAHGMTIEEVRKLESMMQNPSVASSDAATNVVEQLSAEADNDEPEAFHSNMAMKMRTSAAYEVAEAKLNQALMDLRLLVSDNEWQCAESTQKHWKAYRTSLEDWALQEWNGGTGATLAMVLVGMAETERRADEIRAQVKERAER